jgi:AraC-like DNA-binding protein
MKGADEARGAKTEGDRGGDGELVVTEAEIAAYLDENPGMAGSMGTLLDLASRKARSKRQDLTDADFFRLLEQSIPDLHWRRESMAAEILAFIETYRPAPPVAGRPGAPRLTEQRCERQIRAALRRLEADAIVAPTRDDVAAEIGMDPRNLYRWLRRYPALRDLLR